MTVYAIRDFKKGKIFIFQDDNGKQKAAIFYNKEIALSTLSTMNKDEELYFIDTI